MIATRILKFHAEMAEIIEVKVGNPHLEIFILLLHHGRKKYLSYRCQLRPQLSQPFLHGFSKFLWLSCSKFPEFCETSPTFTFRMSFVQEKYQKQSVDGLMGHPVLGAFFEYYNINVRTSMSEECPEAGEEQVCVPGHRAGHADIVRVPAGQHAVAQQTVHMNRYNAVTAKILLTKH